MICPSVIHFEDYISLLEVKEKLSNNDRLGIQCMSKKLEGLDKEFNEYYFTVIDLLEDDEWKSKEEQAILDDHEDQTSDLKDQL